MVEVRLRNGEDARSKIPPVLLLAALSSAILAAWLLFDRLTPWRRYQREFAYARLSALKEKEKKAKSLLEEKFKRLKLAPGYVAPISEDEYRKREREILSFKTSQTSPHARKRIEFLKRGMCDEMLSLISIKNEMREGGSSAVRILQTKVKDEKGEHIDRCVTCHAGMLSPEISMPGHRPFQPHPDRHLVAHHPHGRFGCTVCHEGRGSDLNPSHSTILKGSMVQSSCADCHENVVQLRGSLDALEGARLFQTLGCYSCHDVKQSPYLACDLPPFAPDLSRIKHKVSLEWLIAWISNPQQLKPRTIMPQFGDHLKGMPVDEAAKIASYLMAGSEDVVFSPAALNYAGSKRDRRNGQSAPGRKLVNERGCLGCHDLGRSRAVGPVRISLDDVGSKVSPEWLYGFIESPQSLSPQTTMPRFVLSKAEITSMACYLSTLEKKEKGAPVLLQKDLLSKENREGGRLLISKYGCYSCHRIPGFEKQTRSGPTLDNFGSRPANSLSWGKLKKSVRREERTWYAWTAKKLKDPSAFDSKHLKARMPHYRLSPDEVEKLLIFLRTLKEKKSAPDLRRPMTGGEAAQIAGWQLLNSYGCLGCHSRLDTTYGDTASIPAVSHHDLTAPQTPASRWGSIAPDITFEGRRVDYAWLRDYLKEPHKLRPHLKAEMPQFNFRPGDREKIMSCLGSSAQPPGKGGENVSSLEPYHHGGAAHDELSEHMCYSCHQLNGTERDGKSKLNWYANMTAARVMAPDLAHVNRLKPEWIRKWLANPSLVLPATTMPDTSMTEEEISAVMDYLSDRAPRKEGKDSPARAPGKGKQ